MRKLGQNPTEADLIQMIENVAKPGSKKIGFDEFVDMMEKKNNEEDTEVENIKNGYINQEKEPTIFCSRCGAEMKSKSRYCMKCGNLNYEHDANETMRQYIKEEDQEAYDDRSSASDQIHDFERFFR